MRVYAVIMKKNSLSLNFYSSYQSAPYFDSYFPWINDQSESIQSIEMEYRYRFVHTLPNIFNQLRVL